MNTADGSATRSRPHVPELDFFRASAILLVLAGHLVDGWPLPESAISWMPRVVREIVRHGWLGVDLFFILSGLLITGILVDSKTSQNYFKNFYARRFLRIIPLFWTCVLVAFLCYGGAYFGISLIFLANFSGPLGVAVPHGTAVYWSLAVEEHFYTVWPFLVRYLRGGAVLFLSIALVVLSPLFRGLATARGWNPIDVFTITFFRLDGLALGAILALWTRSRFCTASGAVRLAAALTAMSLTVSLAGMPFGVMTAGTVAASALRSTQAQLVFAAAMAIAVGYRGTALTRVLRTRFMKLTADLSYCIYLIHLSLGDLYYWVLRKRGIDDLASLGPRTALAVRALVICVTAYGIAALSKRFLEDPFLRLKRYF